MFFIICWRKYERVFFPHKEVAQRSSTKVTFLIWIVTGIGSHIKQLSKKERTDILAGAACIRGCRVSSTLVTLLSSNTLMVVSFSTWGYVECFQGKLNTWFQNGMGGLYLGESLSGKKTTFAVHMLKFQLLSCLHSWVLDSWTYVPALFPTTYYWLFYFLRSLRCLWVAPLVLCPWSSKWSIN